MERVPNNCFFLAVLQVLMVEKLLMSGYILCFIVGANGGRGAYKCLYFMFHCRC